MPGYRRYEDAMIAQQRLLEWTRSGPGQRFLHGFYDDLNAKHRPAGQKNPAMLAAIQEAMLQNAEPIFVSPDAAELVDHARKTWKAERVLGSDPFVPYGFALFPRPVLLDDMPPTALNPMRAAPVPPVPNGPLGGIEMPGTHGYIPVRAMAWLSMISEDASLGTFWISFYTNADDEFDLAEELGVPTRWESPPPGYDPVTREDLRRTLPGLSLVHQWQWSWGNDGTHEYGDMDDPERFDVLPDDDIEQMKERARQQCSLVQAFWRIASQFVPARERPQRQVWRNANRAGIQAREVTVITLRRERPGPDYDPDPTGREYHVSFLVRGYWAIRHTRDGPRQTWVRPHVKGQGPFQETTRGWEWTR